MSVRIMADGKAYNRTSCRTVRPFHKARPSENRPGTCDDCGGWLHRVRRGGTETTDSWAHDPGTFWENDMPRFR